MRGKFTSSSPGSVISYKKLGGLTDDDVEDFFVFLAAISKTSSVRRFLFNMIDGASSRALRGRLLVVAILPIVCVVVTEHAVLVYKHVSETQSAVVDLACIHRLAKIEGSLRMRHRCESLFHLLQFIVA